MFHALFLSVALKHSSLGVSSSPHPEQRYSDRISPATCKFILKSERPTVKGYTWYDTEHGQRVFKCPKAKLLSFSAWGSIEDVLKKFYAFDKLEDLWFIEAVFKHNMIRSYFHSLMFSKKCHLRVSSQTNSAQNLDQTCSGRPGKSGWNDAGEFLAVHFCLLCIYIQHRTYHSNMVHMIHTLHIDVERLIMEYLNMYYASFWWQNPKHMDWSGIVECHYDCTTWTCRLAYQLPTIATTALSTGISE